MQPSGRRVVTVLHLNPETFFHENIYQKNNYKYKTRSLDY